MHLQELKQKSPKELLTQAESLGIEDASSMRVQDLIFAILKKVASDDEINRQGGIKLISSTLQQCSSYTIRAIGRELVGISIFSSMTLNVYTFSHSPSWVSLHSPLEPIQSRNSFV